MSNNFYAQETVLNQDFHSVMASLKSNAIALICFDSNKGITEDFARDRFRAHR